MVWPTLGSRTAKEQNSMLGLDIACVQNVITLASAVPEI